MKSETSDAKLPRLLFVSPRFLFPADTGGQIRSGQILRHLNNRRFDITLISPADAQQEKVHADDLHLVCNKFIRYRPPQRGLSADVKRALSLLHPLPASVFSDNSAELRSILSELQLEHQVVIYDFIHSAVNYVPQDSARTILFTHNVEQNIYRRNAQLNGAPWKRMIWRSQWKKMARFENDALGRFYRILTVSELDAEFFRRTHPDADIKTIPTGVDVDYFKYAPPNDSKTIFFVGSMDYSANIDGVRWFLQDVWPMVRERHADALVKIIGRYPPPALVDRFGRDDRVTFTGWVKDVYQESKDGSVNIVPLRIGSGTRIKMYESLAMGIPIVSTTIGAEGLPVVHEQHFLKADDAGEFADAIDSLLRDADVRARLSRNGRELVEKKFTWEKVADAFADHCEF
ncbi:glycosyltransferase [candidate division KSB1 bacterium]|nr:glycosyltransferase [candidate division KSB1 bacterium]